MTVYIDNIYGASANQTTSQMSAGTKQALDNALALLLERSESANMIGWLLRQHYRLRIGNRPDRPVGDRRR